MTNIMINLIMCALDRDSRARCEKFISQGAKWERVDDHFCLVKEETLVHKVEIASL